MHRLLLALIFFISLSAQAQNFGNYLVELEKFSYNGRTYHLLTIEARDPNGIYFNPPGPDYEPWVVKVLTYTWKWILDEYVRQGRFTTDSPTYKEASIKETMVDKRSKIQILFDGPNLDNIAAVMRAARQGSQEEQFLSVEHRRNLKIADLVKSENFVEWKNFIKRQDIPSILISVMLKESLRKNFFDFTRGGLPVEMVVGETYAGKIFYFMDKYGFRIVDYEEQGLEEKGYRTRLLEQQRANAFDPAFVRSLKGFFTITAPREVFVGRIQNEVQTRMAENEVALGELRPQKVALNPDRAVLSCRFTLAAQAGKTRLFGD